MSRRPQRAAAGSAALRGGLLIGVAVVIGLALLSQGFDDDTVGAGPTPTTTKTSTTAPGATETTVVQPHDAAQVHVLVLNGSGKSGVAKQASDQLKAANYTVLPEGNAKGGPLAASVVYFVAGYDADAQTVAAKLGLAPSAAQPLPTPVPDTVGDATDANVVVVIGTDAPVAGGAGAGTTTTVAAN